LGELESALERRSTRPRTIAWSPKRSRGLAEAMTYERSRGSAGSHDRCPSKAIVWRRLRLLLPRESSGEVRDPFDIKAQAGGARRAP
jgi:hypothetical protein